MLYAKPCQVTEHLPPCPAEWMAHIHSALQNPLTPYAARIMLLKIIIHTDLPPARAPYNTGGAFTQQVTNSTFSSAEFGRVEA